MWTQPFPTRQYEHLLPFADAEFHTTHTLLAVTIAFSVPRAAIGAILAAFVAIEVGYESQKWDPNYFQVGGCHTGATCALCVASAGYAPPTQSVRHATTTTR
jgi:hypothetical protein